MEHLSDHERILVVDDESQVSDIIAQCLDMEGYRCDTADCAEKALELCTRTAYDLIVSDIMMPGKSGIELLSIVRQRYPDIAIIMVTAVDDRATAVNALQLGAYGYVIKPFDLNEIVIGVVNALERRRLSIQSREYERRLENDVRQRTAEIQRREEEICLRLAAACGYRDLETGTHNKRLGLYSAVLVKELGWTTQAQDEIRISIAMHDIGKIGLPDTILRKPAGLTDEEFEVVKTHTVLGASMLKGSDFSLLNMAYTIALSHHEKWDGSGYPHGLAGKDIPEPARICAVLDVYDALVHARIYRPALPEEEALAIMKKTRGSHFDPEIFDCFMRILPAVRTIRSEVRDSAHA
jgi:putative two-component system response regulator